MTALIGGILLAAGVMLYLLEPVFSGRRAPAGLGDDDYDEGAARRRIALTALRDLEYDRLTGKLDRKDYEELKGELSRDALRQLGPVDDERGQVRRDVGDGERGGERAEERASLPAVDRASRDLEEEIAQIRGALREGLQCVECGHVNRRGARFCGRCGKAVGAAADPTDAVETRAGAQVAGEAPTETPPETPAAETGR